MSAAPILVGGSPSSGTTLLRVLCGRHPRIRSGGELNVFDHAPLFEPRGRVFRALARIWLAQGAGRSYASMVNGVLVAHEDWGWRREELGPLVEASSSWSQLLTTFFARSEDRDRPTRWLEKSPGNVFGYARARESFPGARFVHTVRDGRDAIASLVARGHSSFRATTRWYCSTLAGLALGEQPDVLHVSYEALVTDPAGELAGVFRHLGEAYDPSVLAAGDRARPQIESWRNAADAAVSSSSVGRHRASDIEAILAVLTATRLTDDGYALVNASASVLEPVELMNALGYPCDRGRRLRRSERAAIRRELDEFAALQRSRYGTARPCCPTRV